jgi:hypothetical protein
MEVEEFDESEYYENNFLTSMADAHKGIFNSKFFSKKHEEETIITEGSRFIFEYFIFNSLYSVDWKNSFEDGLIREPVPNLTELAMQSRFIKYLKPKTEVTKIQQVIQNYIIPFGQFEVFDNISSLKISRKENGDWDERSGEAFCSYILSIQKLANEKEIKTKFFENLKSSLRFIYAVRNNIFHGSKMPGDYWDDKQRIRVDLYSKIIGATNELFFATQIPGWNIQSLKR